jgi:hypothetical protein
MTAVIDAVYAGLLAIACAAVIVAALLFSFGALYQ